jgi:predicted transcriptional regulator
MKFSIVLDSKEHNRLTRLAHEWRQKKAPIIRAIIMGQPDILVSFLDIEEAKKSEILKLIKCGA